MKLITLTDALKDYQTGDVTVHALDHVSLAIDQKEIVVILGESGSGKSTLLNIMGGLDNLTLGDILLEGISYANYKDAEMSKFRREKFGFIFQNYNLLPLLSVYENIITPLLLDQKKADRKMAETICGELGILEQMDKYPSQLSGGQQQRVAIARALINDPKVIFADEPTGNLDSETGIRVMEILADMVRNKGKTLVMVTHNENLTLYADRIIKMENGKIIEK